MIRKCSTKNGVIGLYLTVAPFFLVFGAVDILAATNPVEVESRSVDAVGREIPFQQPIEENDEPQISGGEMQYQMQILQQEVQELRGLVEELTYELQQMRVTEEDRYLELDSRFQRLSGEGGVADPLQADSGTVPPDEVATEEQERIMYDRAIELTRSRQYELAIAQLEAVIEQYPDGNLAPNAYYWLGEVYAAKPDPDYENARKALSQVITFYPAHSKVPDAAFKLGKVYFLMGDCERATDLLKQVIVHPQSGKSVAKLAETYLAEKVGNCQ